MCEKTISGVIREWLDYSFDVTPLASTELDAKRSAFDPNRT
jgi:hypothetical protein